MADDFFAPPPFKAADSLAGLKRSLRELRLAEREGRFELRGQAVAELALDGETIVARRVKRPSRSPEWQQRSVLRNGADVRKFLDDLKRELSGWSDSDD